MIAAGSNRRKLEAPGAAEFDQKGLTYCASCDGPLFADKDVAVIGGGNAAFETALQLLAYCKTVYLLNRTEVFRADHVNVEYLSGAHADYMTTESAHMSIRFTGTIGCIELPSPAPSPIP